MSEYIGALSGLLFVAAALVYGEALAARWVLAGLISAPLWAWAVAVVVVDLSVFLVLWGLKRWR